MSLANEGAPDDEGESKGLPFTAAVMGALVAGLGILGFFGSPWPPVVALVVAEVGAIGAGLLHAKLTWGGLRDALVAAFSWSVFTVTCTGATIWYAQGRTEVWNVELFIPLLIGLVPFAVVRLIVWQATRKRAATSAAGRPSWRPGAADFALAAAVLAVPITVWTVSSRHVADVQTRHEKAVTRHVLTFVVGPNGVTHQDQPVDSDAIADLCRRAAAADPGTTVRVETSKASKEGAVTSVLSAAQSAGLMYDLFLIP